MSARRPLLRLPLTGNCRRYCHQWCEERRTWTPEWNDVFTDEFRFYLQHHDGRIQCRFIHWALDGRPGTWLSWT
ncbi:transposable element Tcb1 transposase [Trichonephila clavipes]|nr:transposable element Tcb1 transposase [Trichonephila clavipes]